MCLRIADLAAARYTRCSVVSGAHVIAPKECTVKLFVAAALLAICAVPHPARAQQLSSSSTDDQNNVPAPVRQAADDVEQTFRRFRVGIRGGVTLDPELISIGAHATLGPIFTRRVLFRPNVEFAYGEVTTLFAVNLEGIYRLTRTMPRGQWSPYVGGGPMLGFSHLGFTTPAGSNRSFDFGEFDFNGGLNLLAGVERPRGAFIELKTSVYTDPHMRLLFGFTF